MNDFEFCNEIGCRYQDILAYELLKVGILLQCHSSKMFQWNYGESIGGIECKCDGRVKETKNLYFEFNAINKKGSDYTEGGIMKEDNAWLYIIGSGKECWIFSKKQLQSLYFKVKQNPDIYKPKGIYLRTHFDKDMGKATSNGMVISLDYAENLAINHIVFTKDYGQWLNEK